MGSMQIWTLGWGGGQHVGVASNHPFAILLLEYGQGVTRACHRLTAAGRSNHNPELGPHKSPVTQNFDLLDLARPIKLGCVLAGLRQCARSKGGFVHDRLAGYEKDD